jgi:ubiquinol-cytochrome c reductase cytochrome c1 subunit
MNTLITLADKAEAALFQIEKPLRSCRNRLLALSLLFVAALLCGPPPVVAAEAGPRLDTAPIKPTDVASLQSGARTFANYCLNCHSASLMRWNRLMELGLTESQIKDNLMFASDKVGELMTVSFSRKEAKQAFGAAPPDLSVIARARGADWLYSYLRAFYRDPARPTGWNNAVFENVGMPNPLWQLQGERVRVEQTAKGDDGADKKDAHGAVAKSVKYELVKPGSLTPVQYDETVRDLVNFLVYVGEPAATSRKLIGTLVLLFLLALWPLVYLLKREYWKDVH